MSDSLDGDDAAPSPADNLASARAAIAQGARVMFRGSTLRGSAKEAAWLAAHVVSYPFGVSQERVQDDVERFSLEGLPPLHRGLLIGDVEAAGTPILLLHGLVDNRSIFALLRRHLRRRGFGRVWTMNYRVWTTDVRVAARQLGESIEAICEQTGYERIHVIGHSMGGLVARYYIQRLGGDARVHTLVSLGTPHAGTRAARLFPRGVCQQLAPGSEVVTELSAPVDSCQTRFVSIWSDIDALIVPKRSARLDHADLTARNILIRGVGHLSLPIDRRVIHEITATLAQLDSDGGTVTAGITRLEPLDAPTAGPATKPNLRARLRGGRSANG